MVVHIYTNQKKLNKVKNIKFHENWGEFRIKSEKDLTSAIASIKKSYSFIREAIKNNINTGWYAATPREKLHWLKSPEDDENGSSDK